MARATIEFDMEEEAFVSEMNRMATEAQRILAEMVETQAETDRLHIENMARITRIEAALDRMQAR